MKKTKRAVIFGTGSFAEVAAFYLTHDSSYEVVGFTATGDHAEASTFLNLPLVPFEQVNAAFPPGDHEMFVAVGYAKMNSLRGQFVAEAQERGYKMLTYICSKATTWPDLQIGSNCFIFEDNTIQAFVSIGDGTILWSGNHVGHHSAIGANCFITSHVVVSGHCKIGSNSFVGVNATISEAVAIGERNLIGPATLIQKDTGPDEVFLASRTTKYPKDSSRFFR